MKNGRQWSMAVIWLWAALGGCSHTASGTAGGDKGDAGGSGGAGGLVTLDAGPGGTGAVASDAAGGAGGSVVDGSSPDSTASAGGTGGIGGSGGNQGSGHDDCRSDADCPPIPCSGSVCADAVCVLGSQDGFHHCARRMRQMPGSCAEASAPCCTGPADCTAQPHGICLPTASVWSAPVPPPKGNTCFYDACGADSDCTARPNGLCAPTAPRECVYGPCRTNSDCTQGADGRCVLATLWHRSNMNSALSLATVAFCHYSSDPCLAGTDCKGAVGPNGWACAVNMNLQGTTCVEAPSPRP